MKTKKFVDKKKGIKGVKIDTPDSHFRMCLMPNDDIELCINHNGQPCSSGEAVYITEEAEGLYDAFQRSFAYCEDFALFDDNGESCHLSMSIFNDENNRTEYMLHFYNPNDMVERKELKSVLSGNGDANGLLRDTINDVFGERKQQKPKAYRLKAWLTFRKKKTVANRADS